MRVRIIRQKDFLQQHYCILEFKGKFESDETTSKSLLPIGELQQCGGEKYRLEIGVMDLIGKGSEVQGEWLYTETVQTGEVNERVLLVKGVIKKKVVFSGRPCPNMQRAGVEKKLQLTSNLFRQMEIRSTENRNK